MAFNDKTMIRAARFAKASARRIRLMILIGSLIYGRSITRREFFLRRITFLSLYLYGIIAVLATIEASRKSGRAIDSDLRILAYFLEEARQLRKQNQRVFSSSKEKLHKKITAEIVGAVASNLTPEAN
jgi:acyl-CoA dehydrogenase family protein 9